MHTRTISLGCFCLGPFIFLEDCYLPATLPSHTQKHELFETSSTQHCCFSVMTGTQNNCSTPLPPTHPSSWRKGGDISYHAFALYLHGDLSLSPTLLLYMLCLHVACSRQGHSQTFAYLPSCPITFPIYLLPLLCLPSYERIKHESIHGTWHCCWHALPLSISLMLPALLGE